MTGANKQAEWFGLSLSSLLEKRNLKLQERELSVIVLLGRAVHMYVGVIYRLYKGFARGRRNGH